MTLLQSVIIDPTPTFYSDKKNQMTFKGLFCLAIVNKFHKNTKTNNLLVCSSTL